MKKNSLFFGASGQMGTTDVTDNNDYKLVVNTVNQVRNHLIQEVLRRPFLHLFNTIYNDDTKFPDDLKASTPIEDQIPNKSNIQSMRHPPTDSDVVEFLTNSFPDLYMASGDFSPDRIEWGETWSGQGEADKEKITINCRLVQLWLQCAHTPSAIGSARLWFMFIAVFLHQLAHSAVVWYGMGACYSLQLGSIDREAGFYVEKAILGGVAFAEFELEPMRLMEIGVKKDGLYYMIDDKLGTILTRLDTSKGIPIFDFSTLSPAPSTTLGRILRKFSQMVTTSTQDRELVAPTGRKLPPGTRLRPLLQNDRKRIMPGAS